MVLSSQQGQVGGTRSYMYARQQKKGPKYVLLLVIGCVVAVAGWIYWPPSDTAGRDLTDPEGSVSAGANVDRSAFPADRQPGGAEYRADAGRQRPLPARFGATVSGDPARDNSARQTQAFKTPRTGGEGPTSITMGGEAGESGKRAAQNQGDNTKAPLTNRGPDLTLPDNNGAGTGRGERNAMAPGAVADPASLSAGADFDVARLMSSAADLFFRGELVQARELYNLTLHHPRVGLEAEAIRNRMTELNETLIFSRAVVEGDPYTLRYRIKDGDTLQKIASRQKVDKGFLARINGIANPDRIRAGPSIKLVNGPFHAVIDKSAYRMDLYIGAPDADGRRMYVRSFLVGLGQSDSATPTGAWVVRANSKLINPAWTNPRTGRHYKASDPQNPIGNRWIGLLGVDSQSQFLGGYGIHGTIEPESLGRPVSMGCIRLAAADVELVYEMLIERQSTVQIHN